MDDEMSAGGQIREAGPILFDDGQPHRYAVKMRRTASALLAVATVNGIPSASMRPR
jgi:hypothetical protein